MKFKLFFLTILALSAGAFIARYPFHGNLNASAISHSVINMHDMEGWSNNSRMAARQMMKKYGAPNESTKSMMIWEHTGPWKKTIVFANEYKHDFPNQHMDVMQQFIDYNVPPDKFDELAEFNGSIVCNRTNGEISVRCNKEEANFLALNLANDIIEGKIDVRTAQELYSKNINDLNYGSNNDMTQRLIFAIPGMNVGETDISNTANSRGDMQSSQELNYAHDGACKVMCVENSNTKY